MSENTNAPSNSESGTPTVEKTAEKPDSKSTGKPSRTRGQKWRRRVIVAGVTILLCIVGFRAIVPLLLPTVMRQVAAMYDLNADYDALDFSLLSADVGLWNLRVTPKSGGEPVMVVGYCRATISTWGLLAGRLDVERAEAEDAYVVVERLADGTMPLVERFMPKPGANETTPATTQPIEIPLESPLSIKALRLQRGVARLIDRAVTPTTNVQLALNFILSDIGDPELPMRYSMQLHSPEILGALYVDGTGTARNHLVNADLKMRMISLNLQPLRSYLAAFGITPTAGDISATANGKLKMTPADGPTTRQADDPITAVAVKLDLDDIRVTADSRDVASAKQVMVDIPRASPGEVRIESVIVDTVRAYAQRDTQGRIGFSGIALGAEPSSVVQNSTTQPAKTDLVSPTETDTQTPTLQPSGLPIVSLKSLLIRDCGFAFTDNALSKPQVLAFDIQKIELKNISTDPADVDLPSTLTFQARSPGLAEEISVTGDIRAASKVKSVDLKLDVSDISGAVLDPYINPLGLRRAMNSAEFTANVHTSINPSSDSLTAGLKLTDVKLTEADREWFAFSSVNISNVRAAYDGSKIAFGQIAVEGPKFDIIRYRDGTITSLGFTFDPARVEPAVPVEKNIPDESKTPDKPDEMVKLPVVQIDNLTWKGVSINVNDAAVTPATAYKLVDVDLVVSNLLLDQKSRDVAPGTIHLSLLSPGNIESFSAQGTIAPTGEALAFDLSGRAAGVTLGGLRPLLNSMGIDPVLDNGVLDFQIGGDARKQQSGFSANLSLKNVSLADRSGDWIGLGELAMTNATFDGKAAGIEKLSITKPSLRVERDDSGRLSAAGVKLITPTNAPPPPPVDPTLPPIPSRVQINLPIIAKLGELNLDAMNVKFVDRMVQPAVTLTPKVSLMLRNAVLGENAPPGDFVARISVPGLVGDMTAWGSFRAAPTQQTANVSLFASHIGGDALKAYMPNGIAFSTTNGTLQGSVNVDLQHHPDSGSKLNLQAWNLLLEDGLHPDPAVKLDTASIIVDQFDLDKPDRVIALKEIVTRGFALRIFENDRGLVLPMLVITPVTPTPEAAKPPAAQQLVGEAVDVEKLMEASRIQAPLITVGKLDIESKSISFQAKQFAYPVRLGDLSITGQGIELLGAKPESRPAFDIHFKTKLDRLIDSIDAQATLRPFARDPSVKLHLDVTGIRGNQITALMPKLADQIDGQGLSDGRFTTDLEMQLSFTKRGLFGIDLTRDIGGSFTLKNTALTQAGIERPLAGVQEIVGEQLRISQDPFTINLRKLEITRPAAHLYRDRDGIHVLGLLYKLPVDEIPTTVPVDVPPPAEASDQPVTPVEPPESTAGKSVSGIAIGSLTVSGCDVVVEDRVGKPVTVLPFNELDFEMTGLNTRALTEPIPIKFAVLAGSAKTPMTKEDGTESEPRELFAQFTASGVVTAYPKPNGWIKSSLSAFDLRSVKGIAQQMGIEVGHGTFDLTTDVRMQGKDTFTAKLAPTFNDLRIKDSADGKIQRFMKLQYPLDMVLEASEDADGAISLPVVAPMEAGKLDMGTIIRSAVGAVTAQLVNAVIAAPLKGVSAVAGLVGIDLTKEKDLSPAMVEFQPGESLLTPSQEEQIKQMIQRLKQDETLQIALTHTLGSADMVLSDQRANPSREDAGALAARLRERKFDLQKQRVSLSATLRVAMASQNKELSDQTLEQLQLATNELAETEEVLDDMLGLLRPGAQRYADRRAKSAAIELGQYRLDTIKQRFLESKVKDIANRVAVARPNAKLEGASEKGVVEIKFARRAKQ